MSYLTRIDMFVFQPFERRVGVDTVYGLRFLYDPAVVTALKEFNRACKAEAVDGSRRIHAVGGWLPDRRCWFVETPLLGALRDHLAGLAVLVLPENARWLTAGGIREGGRS